MSNVKSVLCLLPFFILAIVSMPIVGGVAIAQPAPGSQEAQAAPAIESAKAAPADCVNIGSDDRAAAAEGRSVAGADDLAAKIEFFKGGDVVVVTVPCSDSSLPVAARIDSIKNKRSGPTNLLRFQPRATKAALRGGPTNLLRFQPQTTEAALRDGPARLVPLPSPITGAALRDGPADGGVLVTSVEQGSPAWQDGLRQADVIAAVSRSTVRDVAALRTELESAGNTVVLQVRRSGDELIVVLHR